MNKQTQHIFSLSDAVDCMRQIPDNSIQLIIADPPYNINKATWDKIKDYTNWAAKWIEESYRILKLTGNLVIFGGLQYRNSKRGDRFFRNCPSFASNGFISVIKYWYQLKAVNDNE